MTDRGFTLIELMIGLVLIALLMMVALPAYNGFMANSRIRNVADALANGLRTAQVEAIKRNRDVEFIVNPAVGWSIRDVAANTIVLEEPFSEANGQLLIAMTPAGATKLTYSGLGQYSPNTNPSDGTQAFTSIRITHTATSSPHDLRVTADPALGVGVRVCDKRFAPTDPFGCPAGVP